MAPPKVINKLTLKRASKKKNIVSKIKSGSINRIFFRGHLIFPIGGSKGEVRDAPPDKIFNFMQFWVKIGQNNGLVYNLSPWRPCGKSWIRHNFPKESIHKKKKKMQMISIYLNENMQAS